MKKYTQALIPYAFIFAFTFIAFACGGGGGDEKTAEENKTEAKQKDKQEAQTTEEQKMVQSEADEFFAAVSSENFDKAMNNLHENALKANPKKDWLKLLIQTNEQFGKLTKNNKIDEQIDLDVIGSAGKGNYYQLIYENEYEKIKLYEKLLFVKETGSDKPKMLGYSYNSEKEKITFEQLK